LLDAGIRMSRRSDHTFLWAMLFHEQVMREASAPSPHGFGPNASTAMRRDQPMVNTMGLKSK
jgi:hypothetical protein